MSARALYSCIGAACFRPAYVYRCAVALFLVSAVATGCAVSVKSIRENPERYVGSTLIVEGTVEHTVTVPLVNLSLLTIQDRGSSIILISSSPRAAGDRVLVRARVLGVSERQSLADTQSVVQSVSTFLVYHRFVKQEQAEAAAKSVLRVVSGVAGSVHGSYFLVEESN